MAALELSAVSSRLTTVEATGIVQKNTPANTKAAFFGASIRHTSNAASRRRSQAVRAEAPAEGAKANVASRPAVSQDADLALQSQRVSSGKSLVPPTPKDFVSRYGDNEPRKGCDILVEALEREGVRTLFAYPGGASLEIHQALTRSPNIRTILCRHEQGEVFAAEGYAKVSGRVGVCIATSGPGATNLVTGLADAMLDSVPLVAITGQVPRPFIGTDAFQETPIVEVTRSITKHNYLVMDVDDIPRIVREAFFLAASGRPGPVLIDVPKDVQQTLAVPSWNQPMRLNAYLSRLPPPPQRAQVDQILRLLRSAKRPVVYLGGGCLHAADEIREFARLAGVPVVSTLMGLGVYDQSAPDALHMLGMHGTVYANYAVDASDLLLAFGVRFDDRVTGKLDAFAARASIVHIDIDPAEIGKNKEAHVSMHADTRPALALLNAAIKEEVADGRPLPSYAEWRDECMAQKEKWPLKYPQVEEAILPQEAIEMLYEITKGEAVIATGVGQHQMWAAQFFKYQQPRRWITSGGLGSMGFGLPSALGAIASEPGLPVIDIDGDGSFIMNVQELATITAEKLPVKIMILNNQHLGMVVQWEDRFYKANRAHTFLGLPDNEDEIFPDFTKFAAACKVPSERVTRKAELRGAIERMLAAEGPYLLDIIVPHQEHVLPMIPGGRTFKDIITDGDGRQAY
ncbi:unnamed protein product [Closterium sp. NIES-64]|nr:unnamed protein product [Closterium sp. NIES-64]CAI6007562.1 unnamed protein product [Closterium sp. NIES-65]CAI6010874.1 unnamed protein product [Closterium sp. NIES-65]